MMIRVEHATNIQIKFKTTILSVHILVQETILIFVGPETDAGVFASDRKNKQVMFNSNKTGLFESKNYFPRRTNLIPMQLYAIVKKSI